MCKIVEETTHESVQTSSANQPANLNLRKNLLPIENICEDINRILSSPLENPPTSAQLVVTTDQSQVEPKANAAAPESLQDDCKPAAAVEEVRLKELARESEPNKETSKSKDLGTDQVKEKSDGSSCKVPAPAQPCPPQTGPSSLPKRTENDVEIEERKSEIVGNGSTEKTKKGVIVLDVDN